MVWKGVKFYCKSCRLLEERRVQLKLTDNIEKVT